MSVLDKFQLNGKIALVTGCKRGIGMAMAIGLAEAGADIIGVSATLEKSGSAIEKEVTKLGRKFTAYTCDFSHRESLYAFIKEVKKDFPKIDILVNNAGGPPTGPSLQSSRNDFEKAMETHLYTF